MKKKRSIVWSLLFLGLVAAFGLSMWGMRILILNEAKKYHASLQSQLAESGILLGHESIRLTPWLEVALGGLRISWSNGYVYSEQGVFDPNILGVALPKMFGNPPKNSNLLRSVRLSNTRVSLSNALASTLDSRGNGTNSQLQEVAERVLEGLKNLQSPQTLLKVNNVLGGFYCPFIGVENLEINAHPKALNLRQLSVSMEAKSRFVHFNIRARQNRKSQATLEGRLFPRKGRVEGRLHWVQFGRMNKYEFDFGLLERIRGVEAPVLSVGLRNVGDVKSPKSLKFSYHNRVAAASSNVVHSLVLEGRLDALAQDDLQASSVRFGSLWKALFQGSDYEDLTKPFLNQANQQFWGLSAFLGGKATPRPILLEVVYEPKNPQTNLRLSLRVGGTNEPNEPPNNESNETSNATSKKNLLEGHYSAQRKTWTFHYSQGERSGVGGTLRFVRPKRIEGRLVFKDFSLAKADQDFEPGHALNGPLSLTIGPEKVRLNFGLLSYKGASFGQGAATLRLQRNDNKTVSGFRLGGSADNDSLRFEYRASHTSTSPEANEHHLKLQFRRHSFGVLASVLGLEELENEFVNGDVVFDHGQGNLSGSVGLQIENLITGRQSVGLNVSLDNKKLLVSDSFVRYKALNCESVHVSYSGEDKDPSAFLAMRLNGKGMAMHFDRVEHRKSHSLFASTRKNVRIHYSPSRRVLKMSANKTYLSLLGRVVSGSVRYSLLAREGEGWLQLAKPNPTEENLIRALFDIKNNVVKVNNITYRDKTKVLKGSGSLLLDQGMVYSMNLKDPSSEGFLNLSGRAIGGGLESSLVVKQVPLGEWFPSRKFYVNGHLRAQIELIGNPFNPDIRFKGFVNDYRHFTRLYTIYMDVDRFQGAWHLNVLDVYSNGISQAAKPVVTVVQGKQKSSVKNFRVEANDFQSIQQVSGEFFCSYNPRTKQGFLSSSEYKWNNTTLKHLYTFFAVQEGRIVFRSPQSNGVEGFFPISREGGAIDLRYLFEGKERFVALGRHKPGELSLELFSDVFQANNLNFIVPLLVESEKPKPKLFRLDDERLKNQAINFYLKVHLANGKTTLNGYAQSEGRIKLQQVDEFANHYSLDMSVEDNVVHVTQAHLDYEDGWLSVEGNLKLNDNLSLNNIDLVVKTSEDKGILVDSQIEQLHYRGRVGGEVAVAGNLSVPQLSGTIHLTKGDLQLSSFRGTSGSSLRSGPSPKHFLYNADYDLVFEAKGRSVRFESDILSFPVQQGEHLQVEGNFARGDHKLSGNIKGKEKSGTFTYQGIDFQIKSIEVYYAGEVGTLSPIVTLLASLKRKDHQNDQSIEVRLETSSDIVHGGDYRLSSIPAKSRSDIESILGLQNTEEQPNSYQDYFVDKASKTVANRIVLNPLERSARRVLNLDLFQIDTDLYKILTQSPNFDEDDAVNVSFSMGKYLGYNFFVRLDTELEFRNTVPTQFESTTLGMEYFLFNYFNIEANYSLDPESEDETTFRVDKTWQF